MEDINHVNKQAIHKQELDQIHNWLIANGLKLNTNNKFLRLHVSSDITWNLHIDEMSKKISRITGILKKLQLIVPKNILLTIYITLILPHINYGLLVWGNKSGKILQVNC